MLWNLGKNFVVKATFTGNLQATSGDWQPYPTPTQKSNTPFLGNQHVDDSLLKNECGLIVGGRGQKMNQTATQAELFPAQPGTSPI